ncbi:Crp/Fnr family transcriptional regulator [Plantactinospora sp. BC1]|uniref:Crp/Fnr family transcriptional regulator n=1 Tax=Plantactinospora sp. BC1 TaxID=2108470 RepID=UPI000D16D1FE|nr:Crp/Fnr family transcriptional regulator [Plantactinospora sp. BC1]AVT33649.1 Crp/Fnr family transcriptional regulator [Plantactinospora sp. BC1]
MNYFLYVTDVLVRMARQLADRIPAEDWFGLLDSGVPVHFLDRQILFHQGDVGRHVYALRRGTVKVVRVEADGGQAILTCRTAGDVLGDMAALDGGRRSATVVALGRVDAQMVTAAQFRAFVARPAVFAGFTLYTVERLREADTQRSEIALLPVRARVARALLRLHDNTVIRMAQQDLACYAGASRNAIVEELGALRAAQIIRTARRAVVIADFDRLRTIAEL